MAGLFRTASKQPNPLGTAIRTRGSGKYTFGLALSAGLAGLLYGYDTVSISGAIEFLRARYGLSTLMEGLVVSSIMLGAVIGAATAGFLSDRFGRKRILIIGGAFFLVAAVWSALTIGPIALIVARGRRLRHRPDRRAGRHIHHRIGSGQHPWSARLLLSAACGLRYLPDQRHQLHHRLPRIKRLGYRRWMALDAGIRRDSGRRLPAGYAEGTGKPTIPHSDRQNR